MFFKKVRKTLENPQENTRDRVSFWYNFFELLKLLLVISSFTNHKFVKSSLYCKWASFKFSISSFHLNIVYILRHSSTCFSNLNHSRNLLFSVQAGFNYGSNDYFQLVYMQSKLRLNEYSARFTVMKFLPIIVILLLLSLARWNLIITV